MPSPPGHPAHQTRSFTVTVKLGARYGGAQIHVEAQTRDDAILRVGAALAATHPDADPAGWIVTGVTDPAPRTWTPPRAGRRG